MSVREAICWAVNKGYKRCVFVTDGKLVIDAIHGSIGRTPFHVIVVDHGKLFKHFDDVLACYVSRTSNGVAHLLGKTSSSMPDLLQEWMLSP